MTSKAERVEEFLRRLAAAPAATSAEEAIELLASTLNGVEDEFTTIPYVPAKWMTDGRMYPPQPDSARPVPGRPDLVRYRNRAHNTVVGTDGSIEISEVGGKCLLSKPGRQKP